MTKKPKKEFNFYVFATKTAYLSLIGGLVLGDAYHFGLISDDGWWVKAFTWLAELFLDVPLTINELLFAGLLLTCGLGFRANFIFDTGRVLLAKCILGLSPVPLVAVFASPLIPDFRGISPICIFISVQAYIISATMWHFLSDIKTSVDGWEH